MRRTAAGALIAICCLVLVGSVAAAPPEAQDPRLEVQVGTGTFYRPEKWTPVWVRARNRGPDFVGKLVLRNVSPRDPPDRYERAVELPRNSTKEFVFWVLPPPSGPIRVGLESAACNRWEEVPLAGLSACQPVGLLEPGEQADRTDSALAVSLADGGCMDARVFPLRPDRLPDRALGYDGFVCVVVNPADGQAFARPEQAEAFSTWVRLGGRAVLVVPRGVGEVRGTVFESMLPAELGPTAEVAPVGEVAAWLKGQGVEAVRFQATTAPRGEGQRVEAGGVTFAVRGTYGLGDVTVLTIDPTGQPFRRWRGLTWLWAGLQEARYPPFTVLDDWAGEVPQFLEAYPVAAPLNLYRLAGLLLGYACLVGPLNWLVVRRLRRLRGVLASIVVWVLVFGAAVYMLGIGSRGTRLSLRVASLVDVPGVDGPICGRTVAALYSPSARAYDLAGEARRSLVMPCPPFDRNWGQFRGQRDGSCLDASDTVALRNFWMTSASMKFFALTWEGEVGEALPVRAVLEGRRLKVSNRTGEPLRDLCLLTRTAWWFGLGDAAAGTTLTIEIPQPPSYHPMFLLPYRPGKSSEKDWSRMGDFCARALYARCQPQGRWMSAAESRTGDPELSRPAVLLATIGRSPCALHVAGESPETLEVCVLRIVVE